MIHRMHTRPVATTLMGRPVGQAQGLRRPRVQRALSAMGGMTDARQLNRVHKGWRPVGSRMVDVYTGSVDKASKVASHRLHGRVVWDLPPAALRRDAHLLATGGGPLCVCVVRHRLGRRRRSLAACGHSVGHIAFLPSWSRVF